MSTVTCNYQDASGRPCNAVLDSPAALVEHKAIYHSSSRQDTAAAPRIEPGKVFTTPLPKQLVKEQPPIPTKVCSRCGETKCVLDFYSDPRNTKDGRTARCKKCVGEVAHASRGKKAPEHPVDKLLARPLVASHEGDAFRQLVKDREAEEEAVVAKRPLSVYCPGCFTIWKCKYAQLTKCPGGCTCAVQLVRSTKELKVEVVD